MNRVRGILRILTVRTHHDYMFTKVDKCPTHRTTPHVVSNARGRNQQERRGKKGKEKKRDVVERRVASSTASPPRGAYVPITFLRKWLKYDTLCTETDPKPIRQNQPAFVTPAVSYLSLFLDQAVSSTAAIPLLLWELGYQPVDSVGKSRRRNATKKTGRHILQNHFFFTIFKYPKNQLPNRKKQLPATTHPLFYVSSRTKKTRSHNSPRKLRATSIVPENHTIRTITTHTPDFAGTLHSPMSWKSESAMSCTASRSISLFVRACAYSPSPMSPRNSTRSAGLPTGVPERSLCLLTCPML